MRQSLQLAVGHEDDIAYFTILRTILYTPLRSQRVRRACVYLSSPVIQKYADVIPLKYISRALLHLHPPGAISGSRSVFREPARSWRMPIAEYRCRSVAKHSSSNSTRNFYSRSTRVIDSSVSDPRVSVSVQSTVPRRISNLNRHRNAVSKRKSHAIRPSLLNKRRIDRANQFRINHVERARPFRTNDSEETPNHTKPLGRQQSETRPSRQVGFPFS